jgi:hypothetical protein
MLERFAQWAAPFLTYPYILRTRRNHGLEHATIHVLSRQRYRLSGRSDDSGFIVIGNVPTDKLENAVNEAIRRMQNGEHQLAIHPNCGTNLITTGFLATVVGLLGFGGRSLRKNYDRFSMVMIAMMGVVLFSPPLGMALQKHITTEGDIGDMMQLVSVTKSTTPVPFSTRQVVIHRVVTQQE